MPASRRVPVGFALLLAVAASSPVRAQDRRPPGDSKPPSGAEVMLNRSDLVIEFHKPARGAKAFAPYKVVVKNIGKKPTKITMNVKFQCMPAPVEVFVNPCLAYSDFLVTAPLQINQTVSKPMPAQFPNYLSELKASIVPKTLLVEEEISTNNNSVVIVSGGQLK